MKIGIDARFWGLEHAGIGRYVMELISELQRLDKKNFYTLYVRRKYKNFFSLPQNFEVVVADVPHYSVAEQWLAAEIFNKSNLDLLHVPHFNVPLLYKRPFVVTIHDLLWHEVKGMSVTTQSPLRYLVKHVGYRFVVRNALNNAKAILVPSQTIKNKLTDSHNVLADKITVTYEAPGRIFFISKKDPYILKKYQLPDPYILYVGTAYPHKNILSVIDAVIKLNKETKKIALVIVSARTVFLDRLLSEIAKRNATKLVKILGFVPDRDLAQLYAHSLALIQPSLSEGFGLTGLEAMSAGTAVIASDIDIFKEIYQDVAQYCNPTSHSDIASNIDILLSDDKRRIKLIQKSIKRVQSFSWKTLAKQTHDIYLTSGNR